MINPDMQNILIKPRTVIIMTVAVLSLSLCSCKGRRASDMTPNGDTVEVVVNNASTIEESADSTVFNDTIQHEI